MTSQSELDTFSCIVVHGSKKRPASLLWKGTTYEGKILGQKRFRHSKQGSSEKIIYAKKIWGHFGYTVSRRLKMYTDNNNRKRKQQETLRLFFCLASFVLSLLYEKLNTGTNSDVGIFRDVATSFIDNWFLVTGVPSINWSRGSNIGFIWSRIPPLFFIPFSHPAQTSNSIPIPLGP